MRIIYQNIKADLSLFQMCGHKEKLYVYCDISQTCSNFLTDGKGHCNHNLYYKETRSNFLTDCKGHQNHNLYYKDLRQVTTLKCTRYWNLYVYTDYWIK